MKLVLGAGINPRVSHVGPRIRLFAGRWRIVSEHQIDSKMVLVHDGIPREIKSGDCFDSEGSVYHISVIGGTEDYINVFAELENGTQPATDAG